MNCYLGIDIGGQDNTWMAVIRENGGEVPVVEVQQTSLQKIVARCKDDNNVLAVAIDGQLTFSITQENGFRLSDLELKKQLGERFENRVASYNSLMAVPVRGRNLADTISPFVGTIIETHPTACLLLGLDASDGCVANAIEVYKHSGEERSPACQLLWERWCSKFELTADLPNQIRDGHVDALVTATVAWLYNRKPEQLQRLTDDVSDEVGRGPFWVVKNSGL